MDPTPAFPGMKAITRSPGRHQGTYGSTDATEQRPSKGPRAAATTDPLNKTKEKDAIPHANGVKMLSWAVSVLTQHSVSSRDSSQHRREAPQSRGSTDRALARDHKAKHRKDATTTAEDRQNSSSSTSKPAEAISASTSHGTLKSAKPRPLLDAQGDLPARAERKTPYLESARFRAFQTGVLPVWRFAAFHQLQAGQTPTTRRPDVEASGKTSGTPTPGLIARLYEAAGETVPEHVPEHIRQRLQQKRLEAQKKEGSHDTAASASVRDDLKKKEDSQDPTSMEGDSAKDRAETNSRSHRQHPNRSARLFFLLSSLFSPLATALQHVVCS
ncbi:unnamed protein product [Discula destructiva]